jgi:hypothetical protein
MNIWKLRKNQMCNPENWKNPKTNKGKTKEQTIFE